MMKIMKKIGYVLTWPFAKLFRLAVYLDDHEIGSLFAGFMFILYVIIMGIITVEDGLQWGFAIFMFILLMAIGNIGNWAITAIVDILIIVLQPADHFNQHCSMRVIPWERKREQRMKPKYSNDGNPLDKFIRKSAKINCYQMNLITK